MKNIKNSLTSDSFLSYSLKDINDDGTKELIFHNSSYDGEPNCGFIIAMYTLVSGKPELVCTSSIEVTTFYDLLEGDIFHSFSRVSLRDALLKLKPDSKDFDILKEADHFEGEYFDPEEIGDVQTITSRPVGL